LGLEFLSTRAGLTRMGRIGSSSRDDLEIPEIALREALANAIVHRDYEDDVLKRQPTRIEVYPDRIEITSFGTLLGGITVEDLNDDPEHITAFRRNEIVATIFQYMAYVELFGSGISRIYRLTKKAELKKPKIEFNEKQPTVKIILYRPEQTSHIYGNKHFNLQQYHKKQ